MSLLEFRHARRLVGLAIGLYFVAHLYYLSLPPNGYHHWRESDTAAVILNYHQESMNFLEPRVNQRGTTSGVAGMELPLYNYATALVYTVTGPSHAAARTLTLLAACLGLWIFFCLTSLMVPQKAAALATWALAFSPLYFFYGFKASFFPASESVLFPFFRA